MRRVPSVIVNFVSALSVGLVMLLVAPGLSVGGEPAARRAVDILGIRWVNTENPNPLTPHHTYHSAAMDCDVGYSIYLPPDYAGSAVRYPVVYWLTGLGGNEFPNDGPVPQELDAAIRAKKLPPLIFVFANGGHCTRYYDSLDRSIMAETTIIKELIPYIDANYRTLAAKECRAIQGSSMGGMGTLKFAFKYPELFSSAFAFCPAMLTADAMMTTDPKLIPALFNGDKTLFTKDSPAAMIVTNADNIRGKLAIKISIGSEDGLLKYTEQLHASMVKLKISHEVEIIGGLGHELRIEAQMRALRYAVEHFTLPQA